MSYRVMHWAGDMESGTDSPTTRFGKLLDELVDPDGEHPDVGVTHESEWSLSAFRSGLRNAERKQGVAHGLTGLPVGKSGSVSRTSARWGPEAMARWGQARGEAARSGAVGIVAMLIGLFAVIGCDDSWRHSQADDAGEAEGQNGLCGRSGSSLGELDVVLTGETAVWVDSVELETCASEVVYGAEAAPWQAAATGRPDFDCDAVASTAVRLDPEQPVLSLSFWNAGERVFIESGYSVRVTAFGDDCQRLSATDLLVVGGRGQPLTVCPFVPVANSEFLYDELAVDCSY